MKRCLLVAVAAVLGSLVLGMVLSGAAIGAATIVADGWDEIGAMLVIGALLFPVWCALSIIGLRLGCRWWLRMDPGAAVLAGVVTASAVAGAGAAWLVAAGAVPGGDWGPIAYGPAAAVMALTALLMAIVRRGRAAR